MNVQLFTTEKSKEATFKINKGRSFTVKAVNTGNYPFSLKIRGFKKEKTQVIFPYPYMIMPIEDDTWYNICSKTIYPGDKITLSGKLYMKYTTVNIRLKSKKKRVNKKLLQTAHIPGAKGYVLMKMSST